MERVHTPNHLLTRLDNLQRSVEPHKPLKVWQCAQCGTCLKIHLRVTLALLVSHPLVLWVRGVCLLINRGLPPFEAHFELEWELMLHFRMSSCSSKSWKLEYSSPRFSTKRWVSRVFLRNLGKVKISFLSLSLSLRGCFQQFGSMSRAWRIFKS